MRLDINPRGNGACPLCVSNRSCRVQRRLAENVSPLSSPADASGEDGLEVVIYSCPLFKERVAP